MKVVTDYNPNISNVLKEFIRDEVNPSMSDGDGTSCQYEVIQITEAIKVALEDDVEGDAGEVEMMFAEYLKTLDYSPDYLEF